MQLQTQLLKIKETLSLSDLLLKDQYHPASTLKVYSMEKMLYSISKKDLIAMILYLKQHHLWFLKKQSQSSFTLYEDLFILCALKLNQANICESSLRDIVYLIKFHFKRSSKSIKQRIDQLSKCQIERIMQMVYLDYDIVLELNNETIKFFTSQLSSNHVKVSFQRPDNEELVFVGVHNKARKNWITKHRSFLQSPQMTQSQLELLGRIFNKIQTRLVGLLFKHKGKNISTFTFKKKNQQKEVKEIEIVDSSMESQQSTTLAQDQEQLSKELLTSSQIQERRQQLRKMVEYFYASSDLRNSKVLDKQYYFNDYLYEKSQALTLRDILQRSEYLIAKDEICLTEKEQMMDLKSMLAQISHQIHKWFNNAAQGSSSSSSCTSQESVPSFRQEKCRSSHQEKKQSKDDNKIFFRIKIEHP